MNARFRRRNCLIFRRFRGAVFTTLSGRRALISPFSLPRWNAWTDFAAGAVRQGVDVRRDVADPLADWNRFSTAMPVLARILSSTTELPLDATDTGRTYIAFLRPTRLEMLPTPRTLSHIAVSSLFFFEFQGPYNLLAEPLPLLALELLFWAICALGASAVIVAMIGQTRTA